MKMRLMTFLALVTATLIAGAVAACSQEPKRATTTDTTVTEVKPAAPCPTPSPSARPQGLMSSSTTTEGGGTNGC